jgi:hypothetical protein
MYIYRQASEASIPRQSFTRGLRLQHSKVCLPNSEHTMPRRHNYVVDYFVDNALD